MVAASSMLNSVTRRSALAVLMLLCWFAPLTTTISQDNAAFTFVPQRFHEWHDTLKSYSPNVVVVDMWATWCWSCLEQFPKMVELHKRYADASVRFVSLNLDDHKDLPSLAKAEEFLKKMNAEFDHFWMDENLMVAFEQLNLIGIPAVIIYDQEGTERYRLTGDDPNNQFTDKDIIDAIEKLLGH